MNEKKKPAADGKKGFREPVRKSPGKDKDTTSPKNEPSKGKSSDGNVSSSPTTEVNPEG